MKETCNAFITEAVIGFDDYGRLQFRLCLEGFNDEGKKFIKLITGYPIGEGHIGATVFKGDARGTEAIMRIMDVVGVDEWGMLRNKVVRIPKNEVDGWNHTIGNAIEDKWLDLHEIFPQKPQKKVDVHFGEADSETRDI